MGNLKKRILKFNKLIIMKKTKQIAILLLSMLFITINSFGQGKGQKKYLPKQFQDVYFGMNFTNFKKVKNVEDMKMDSVSGPRIEYIETEVDKEISEVTYYFTKDKKNILYEIIIQYEPDFDLESLIEKLFGLSITDEEFLLNCGESYKMKAWTFESTLVIAAKIKGTEWYE
jgi:hypothetical protein